MTTQMISIGDSVLARHNGNEVPGVVSEIEGNEVVVALAEPYLAASGEPRTDVRCAIDEVTRILDDADSVPELPA